MNWTESFAAYAFKAAKMYEKDRQTFISCLKFDSIYKTLHSSYINILKIVDLRPIEEISQDLKLKYWNQAKQIHDEPEARLKISCCLYLLDELTKPEK